MMRRCEERTTRDLILYDILIPALQCLYKVDYANIYYRASERNICARLAHHIENRMRDYDKNYCRGLFADYYADVEYNRMGNGDLKHYENSEHKPKYMVSDLLIQKRGYGRNLLAVEMKRKGNKRGVETDKKRLKALVSSPNDVEMARKCVHDTLFGTFIIYSEKSLTIEVFENIDGKGIETDLLYFEYNKEAEQKLISTMR